MDKRMLLVFYGYAQKNKAFGRVVRLVYRCSTPVFAIIYYAGGLYLAAVRKEQLALYIVVPLIQLVVNLALRRLFKRRRPYLALGLTPPINKEKNLLRGRGSDSYSFPSNHSSAAGIIAFACMYVNPAFGTVVFVLALFTGLSRIFSGVHYPSDVVSGFVLSAVFAILGFSLLPSFLAMVFA